MSAADPVSITETRRVAPSAAGSAGSAGSAWSAWSAAARLTWLHLRSRRVPSALVALTACGVVLWVAMTNHWWLGTRPSELPILIEGAAAAIIAVTTHNPFGEPERATGRWLPFLRLSMALALCGAAIGLLAAAAAAAYNPHAGVALNSGILGVAENVMGFAGIGLIFSLVTGGLLAWTGPLGLVAINQFAVIAYYSDPLTWAARPATDRGGWIAATVVYVVGLAAFATRGPRVRPSGE